MNNCTFQGQKLRAVAKVISAVTFSKAFTPTRTLLCRGLVHEPFLQHVALHSYICQRIALYSSNTLYVSGRACKPASRGDQQLLLGPVTVEGLSIAVPNRY